MIRRQEGITRRKTIQGVLPASKWYLLSIQVIIIRTVQALPQSSVMLLLPMAAAAAAAATEGAREVAVALTTRRTMVRTMPAETIEMAGVAKAVAVVVINRLQQIAIVAARTVMWIAAAVSVAASRLSKDRTDSNRSPLFRRAAAQAIGPVTTTTMAIVHNWSDSSGPNLNCNRLSNCNSSINNSNNIYRSSNNNIK